ncbi:MAG: radical SAM family heme chaperone HemW [Spirochaetaceae bacterium]|nr:radical SAM family heme chaperone HemW [Spirochaetaceae bacterium]
MLNIDKNKLKIDNNLSLYLHIPFCLSKCHYCDFFSQPNISINQQQIFASKVLRHIDSFFNYLDINKLSTLYIGGGTPSILPEDSLFSILQLIKKYSPLEATIEVNPQQVNPSLLNFLFDNGVTRISMGLQSLDEEALKIVNRPTTYEQMMNALNLLAAYRQKVNIDIIAGLSNRQKFNETINKLLEINPSHISFYSLTIEEDTPLFNKQRLLPNVQEQEHQWFLGRKKLIKAGYHNYEISNYAKNNCYSRHNLAYWQGKSYLGVGAGAASTLYYNDATAIRLVGTEDLTDWFNEEDITKLYISEELTKKELIFESFMLSLRTSVGLDKAKFKERFGQDSETYLGSLSPKALSCLSSNEKYIKVNHKGKLFLNNLLHELKEII